MGKLGGYEYPDWTLTEVKRIAEIIEQKLDKEVKEEALATLLGHKTVKSGGYQTKLVALRRWGLSDGNRLTELAERLLHPRKGEEWQIVLECIRKVDLFWKILKRNPESVPSKEGFWEELVAITGVDRLKAEKEAEKVLKIYRNAYDYLSRVKPEGTSMKEIIAGVAGVSPPPPTKEAIFPPSSKFVEIRFDDIYIKLPPTLDAVEIAKTLLELQEKRIRTRVEGEGERPEGES